MLEENDRKLLLKIARNTIDNHVLGKKMISDHYPEALMKKRGVFCTLYKINKNSMMPEGHRCLRGCIGLPYPVKPLVNAVVEAAISSCHDPRFPPLRRSELKKIEIELSVLTEPELIAVKHCDEYLEKINVGEDGLIISYAGHSGLLLPQVASEYKWNAAEFLHHLCLKAGLQPLAWMDRDAKIWRFHADMFDEED
ncbi:MAG: TIGR00296 family protein [Candidatus Aenigmatarchaeota archaeon]